MTILNIKINTTTKSEQRTHTRRSGEKIEYEHTTIKPDLDNCIIESSNCSDQCECQNDFDHTQIDDLTEIKYLLDSGRYDCLDQIRQIISKNIYSQMQSIIGRSDCFDDKCEQLSCFVNNQLEEKKDSTDILKSYPYSKSFRKISETEYEVEIHVNNEMINNNLYLITSTESDGMGCYCCYETYQHEIPYQLSVVYPTRRENNQQIYRFNKKYGEKYERDGWFNFCG